MPSPLSCPCLFYPHEIRVLILQNFADIQIQRTILLYSYTSLQAISSSLSLPSFSLSSHLYLPNSPSGFSRSISPSIFSHKKTEL